MAFELFGGAIIQGALTSAAIGGVSNIIQGRDPFSNLGQSLLMGGITGGIFGGLGPGKGFEGLLGSGTPSIAQDLTSGQQALNAQAAKDLAAIEAMPGPSTMVANTGNASVDLLSKNVGNQLAGMPPPTGNYISDPESALAADKYKQLIEDQSRAAEYTDPEYIKRVNLGAESAAPPQPPLSSTPAAPAQSAPSPQSGSPLNKPAGKARFLSDPIEWVKQNEGRAAIGAGLGLMALTNRNPGLTNLPPRTYQQASTTYAPGTRNPLWGQPGEPYFLQQGYAPMTYQTRAVREGGGIKAMRRGGSSSDSDADLASYVPLQARGFMSSREEVPTSLEDSSAFKRYAKSNVFADEKKEQDEADKNVLKWVKKYTEETRNAASGGLMEPRRMATGGITSPLFQQVNNQGAGDFTNYLQGLNAGTTPAITSSPMLQQVNNQGAGDFMGYLQGLNARVKSAPVSPQASAPTLAPIYNTTDATVYDPVSQAYIANPNYVAPATQGAGDAHDNYFDSSGGDKAGGPIRAKKLAIGGPAMMPEYAAGGKLLDGPGDGMSDDIPAVIKGERPQRAALADGEFVIPADVVSHLGNGSTKAGGQRLYEMMDRVRKARTGNVKQGKQINPMKFMPT